MPIALLLYLGIVSSPYPFEVASGLTAEGFARASLNDSLDAWSAGGGLRMGYYQSDQTDSMISPELEFAVERVTSESALQPEIKNKYLLLTGLSFTEIYHPLAFRFAALGGAEFRGGQVFAQGAFRAGLGSYFASRFSIWLDANSRLIYRAGEREGIDSPIDIDISLQAICF